MSHTGCLGTNVASTIDYSLLVMSSLHREGRFSAFTCTPKQTRPELGFRKVLGNLKWSAKRVQIVFNVYIFSLGIKPALRKFAVFEWLRCPFLTLDILAQIKLLTKISKIMFPHKHLDVP